MSTQMKKMLFVVGVVLGTIFGWYGIQKLLFIYFVSSYEPPPVTVSASTATANIWQSYLSSVGTLTAINGVDISAEVPGIVKEINFNSGQFVNQGDLLVQLDTSVEQADLKSNIAKLKLAQINFERYQTLQKKNAVSQAVFDTSQAELKEAEAAVEATQARIKQKTLTAPFSGKIGIRQINIGEYVAPGTAMASLQTLDPLYVKFNLPEQYLPLLYLNQPIEISVNTSEKKSIAGTITAINSKVDQNTRNILVQATIPNKNLELYPGMFALIKVWLKEQKNVVILPQTAISYSLHGDSVFIIKDKGNGKKGKPNLHAYRQYIEVGERRDNIVSILKGLKAGDQVVNAGQLKLQNGTHVVIDNSVEL